MFAQELSHYELMRKKNMEERQSLIAALTQDAEKFKHDLQEEKIKKTGQKKRKRAMVLKEENNIHPVIKEEPNNDVCDPWLRYATHSPPRTRSRGTRIYTDTDSTDSPESKRITYRFSFMKSGSVSSDYDCEDAAPKRRRGNHSNSSIDPNINVLMPDDVTPGMLAAIAESSTDKTYCATGITCHQCRQKTTDTKTVCRSLMCVGVRGKFCDPCLKNRYGQEVSTALLDPEWSCPPCRGICNCSICRTRQGKPATGILINLARARGYDNVNDYLESLMKNTEEDFIVEE